MRVYFWLGLFIGTAATLMAGAFACWLDSQAELRRLRSEQEDLNGEAIFHGPKDED